VVDDAGASGRSQTHHLPRSADAIIRAGQQRVSDPPLGARDLVQDDPLRIVRAALAKRVRQRPVFRAHLLVAVAGVEPQVVESRHLVEQPRGRLDELLVSSRDGDGSVEVFVVGQDDSAAATIPRLPPKANKAILICL
jgi:hypothetical protein